MIMEPIPASLPQPSFLDRFEVKKKEVQQKFVDIVEDIFSFFLAESPAVGTSAGGASVASCTASSSSSAANQIDERQGKKTEERHNDCCLCHKCLFASITEEDTLMEIDQMARAQQVNVPELIDLVDLVDDIIEDQPTNLPPNILQVQLHFRCWHNHCGRIFDKQVDLDQHILATHTNGEIKEEDSNAGQRSNKLPFQCSHCPKQFATSQCHYQHVYQFHQRGDYPCPDTECAFTASYRFELRKHKYSHSNLERCPEPGCERSFRIRSQLTNHQATAHNVDSRPKKPIFRCKWTNCSYSTKQRGRTTKHVINEHLKKQKSTAKMDMEELTEASHDYMEVLQP